MKVSRQQVIVSSPKSIWDAICTVDSLPDWLSGIESAEAIAGTPDGLGRRQWVKKLFRNHDVQIELEVTAWDPGRRLEFLQVRSLLNGRPLTGVSDMRTVLSLSSDGTATQVTAEYQWQARSGLAWLFSLIFGGRVMGRELSESLRKIQGLV